MTQRSSDFLGMIKELRSQGLTETEIAKGLGMTSTELRQTNTIARNAHKAEQVAMAQRLRDKGNSHQAIAERMGLPGESSVRALLAPGVKERNDRLQTISNMLRDEVDKKEYLDVGVGNERYLDISRTNFDTALAMLKSDGYAVTSVQIDQLGTGLKTTTQVLTSDDKNYGDVVRNKDKIQTMGVLGVDGGKKLIPTPEPLSIDSKRIDVRWGEDGGDQADGMIYVRPGVEDVSLGGASYAQVRVAVDGTHYLKGVAVYKDDLPPGIDIQINTPKSNTGNKLDAMKPMKNDKEDPFGAMTKPPLMNDPKDPTRVTSAMNIVNEEGDWSTWSRNLASQMLSKQRPTLAKEQLDKTYDQKKKELDEILSLTNPAVKQRLLDSFADGADASSVHLKAAAMPRQATQVLIAIPSLKDTEVYAPQFKNGERVALIRYPHGGTFEIPELTVNNNNREGKSIITSSALDAVGINHRVASRLSGADFDGDTVLVIPNNTGKVKSTPALEGLKGFDPQRAYPKYEGMKVMSEQQKQVEMGKASNLITDMTIKGAPPNEIAAAVRHSMVVIDAAKHELNHKQSYVDNGIANLKKKYQGGSDAGASTLVSLTTSETRVPHRRASYKVDPKTGEKIYSETGEGYTKTTINKRTGVESSKWIERQTLSTKGAETKDAHDLSSGTKVEKVYADHANRMKALANTARKESVNTKPTKYSQSAAQVYNKEVSSLNHKLNIALKNAPIERKAQVLAKATVNRKRQSNPDMDKDSVKKLESRELLRARTRVGAGKTLVDITPSEWEAIQAGAVSTSKLRTILSNTDLNTVKQYATPRKPTVMTSAKQTRAKSLLAAGRTPSEVADILGVALSTLNSSMDRKG